MSDPVVIGGYLAGFASIIKVVLDWVRDHGAQRLAVRTQDAQEHHLTGEFQLDLTDRYKVLLDSLQARVKDLEARLDAEDARREALMADNLEQARRIKHLESENTKHMKRIKTLESENALLAAEIASLRDRITEMETNGSTA